MTAKGVAKPATQHAANAHAQAAGTHAANIKAPAPHASTRAATGAGARPAACTAFTSTGLSISPMLPPAATIAFAMGPAPKERVATRSRNVLPADSTAPAHNERHRSRRTVAVIRSSAVIRREARPPCRG